MTRHLLLMVRWFLGIFFLLNFISEIVKFTHLISALISFFCAVLFLPPLYSLFGKLILQKTSFNIFALSRGIKAIILISLVFLYGVTSPSQSADVVTTNNNFPLASPTLTSVQVSPEATPISSASPSAAPQLYSVVKVIDGDTLQVKIDTVVQTIRLIGVDTPETVDPRKSVQCFGKEASNKAKELLTGKQVSLENDSTQGNTDKYNRLLRYVYLEDGTLVNKYLIHEGYGFEYTYQSNPYNYQLDFKNAQKYAEENKKGLWADGACATATAQPTAVTRTATPVPATPMSLSQKSSGSVGGYSCAGKTKCGEMTTCAEAQYYLTTCGVSRLDGDSDGVPCESLCN